MISSDIQIKILAKRSVYVTLGSKGLNSRPLYMTCANKMLIDTSDKKYYYYYELHGRVTLFFANISLMQCRITIKFLHNFF